ncbi:hypothetical protein KUCAC02_014754 [Chaenocephalus aceratus]|uniref:Uncharacterized protein n=1 Tax=Chaenocephalus aceratus TaxID=36190 RepID=A0ACB9WF08_CHAAC|nr:hypothetical protein KUCAC02_014754 [Chaenocephalus aceratus]
MMNKLTALHEGAPSCRINVVFDVYWKTSIKNAERCNRGATSGTQWKNIAPGHNIHQWRKFLSNPESKTSLVEFLVEQWKQPAKRERLQDKSLYVTCGEACYLITKDHWHEIQDLRSIKEEADTRMLLHARHASGDGYGSIIITAEDTDVLILCLCFSKTMACQKCGTQNRTRYIDIGKLASSVGEEVCQGLVGLHALTGCDTVSAFAGRGKLSALKHLKENETYQEAFKRLGEAWDVSADLFDKMQDFVCRLYASSSTTSDVNELRYQLFCAQRGEVESSQLPPCKDCLHMHVLRANYQTAIWRRCLVSEPVVPDPKGCGWTTGDDGSLEIEWMQGSPAPDAVLQLMSCKCACICKLPACVCLENQLKCTDMCKLQTCTNQRSEDEDEVAVELDESDTDDEEN